MAAKFQVGQLVRFTGRAPDYLTGDIRKRTRVVTGRYYDSDHRCCYYTLGVQGYNEQPDWFASLRSYMLTPVTSKQAHKIGRPRTKRAYRKKASLNSSVKLRTSPQNDPTGEKSTQAVPNIMPLVNQAGNGQK